MNSAQTQAKSNEVELEDQPRVHVGCGLCGSRRSRLVCSPEDIIAQQRFLEYFYRSRWSQQTAATATDRVSFTQDYATSIVACMDCGLLYRNPRPRAEAVTQAYETEDYDEAYLQAEFTAQQTWARGKADILARHLEKVGRRGRPRVLEIGSFVGGFLLEGQLRGWDMLGVDPGHDVASFCRRHRLPVFEGTLEEAQLPPASFDAVAIWNTFDQLPDPRKLLHQLLPLMRNGGLLVARVPNGACFEWGMSIRARLPNVFRRPLDIALACNNLLTFPYLYGYSAEQLEELTEPFGFRLLACYADQIVSSPPGHLRRWALWEEQVVKTLCRAFAVLWPDNRSLRFRSAPWLDCIFERACTDEERPAPQNLGLGVIPVYSPLVFKDTGLDCSVNR
jgi:SAM-dependent methyltransferase